ncbi:NADH-ubiquinone oxidoreductase chain 2, partial [Bienertia sinuspersici]
SRVELREQPSDGKQLSRSVQRALFSLRILRSLSCEFPSGEFKTFWALSIPSIEPRRKPPSPSDSIYFLTLYMWAPDIYEGSPTPITAFFSIAPKISISANILRVFIYGSYGATLQQIFFFCSIASMILGALAAMAQTKVKRLLAHSSIGHVGYIRTGFSCGTIEGIQSLLIGLFIYASMTIDAFAIVSALRQTRVKYIADLGALAKTNPISAITFSITIKFYLFFAALGCGAYFLAPVGVVTSVIGCWAAGRLPRELDPCLERRFDEYISGKPAQPAIAQGQPQGLGQKPPFGKDGPQIWIFRHHGRIILPRGVRRERKRKRLP